MVKDYKLISFTDDFAFPYDRAIMRDKEYEKVEVPLFLVAAHQRDLKDSIDKFYEQIQINLDLVREHKEKYLYLFLSKVTITEETETIIMFTSVENVTNMKVSAKVGVVSSNQELDFIEFK